VHLHQVVREFFPLVEEAHNYTQTASLEFLFMEKVKRRQEQW
jgi:hypothetical protein